MYCRQCGFNNDKYSKMCKRCGSDLSAPDLPYEERTAPEGGLKYAKQRESFTEMVKTRFRRLERVAQDKRERTIAIIIAVCAVICIAAAIAIPRIKACMEVKPNVYSAHSHTSAPPVSAEGDGWMFYCLPAGDNPGLYRVSQKTGEQLKISHMVIESLCYHEGWLYGIDSHGRLVRISPDGLTVQTVLDEEAVRNINFVNEYVYYLDVRGYICRADLSQVSAEQIAVPETLHETCCTELLAVDGWLYYVEFRELVYKPNDVISGAHDPEWVPGKISWITGKEIPPKYWIDAMDASQSAGDICRMPIIFDEKQGAFGQGIEPLVVGVNACNISIHDDYLYYMTQTEITASAFDLDPDAPASTEIRLASSQFWRFNLLNSKYTRFLDAGAAASPFTFADGWIFFISPGGDMQKADIDGGAASLLVTYADSVEAFSVSGGKLYFLCNGKTQTGCVSYNGTDAQMLG